MKYLALFMYYLNCFFVGYGIAFMMNQDKSIATKGLLLVLLSLSGAVTWKIIHKKLTAE